jgi:hypothetical protein
LNILKKTGSQLADKARPSNMQTLTEQIKSIPIVEVIQNAGVELKRIGGRHVGLCPFHHEEHPSFYIFHDNHFHCFSCARHGDAVDFIQELTGCNFKQALSQLGINRRKQSAAETRRAIEAAQKRLQERRRRKQRESDLAHTLALLIRTTRKVIRNIKTIDDLTESAELIHALPFWKHCHDILISGDRAAILEVLKALKNMQTKDRGFDPDFDFRNWLKDFKKNGANYDRTKSYLRGQSKCNIPR